MENEDQFVVEKLKLKVFDPIIGPLNQFEKEAILEARRYLMSKTSLTFGEPDFIREQDGKEYLYIPLSPIDPKVDLISQMFFLLFEPFFQTTTLKKWVNKNKEISRTIKKLSGLLEGIVKQDVNAFLQSEELLKPLKEFESRWTNIANLSKPENAQLHNKGGSPIDAKTLLIEKIRESEFYFKKKVVKLTPRQIIYVLVAMGIWLPYTDKKTRKTVSLKDLADHKIGSIRATLRRTKNRTTKAIELSRVAYRTDRYKTIV